MFGGIGHVIGGTVGKLAVTAFEAIIHALFAPIARFINRQLIAWLVAVPDYAPPGSHVATTEHTVLAMTGGVGPAATISVARFWRRGSPAAARRRWRVLGADGRRGVGVADLAVDLSHGDRAVERRELLGYDCSSALGGCFAQGLARRRRRTRYARRAIATAAPSCRTADFEQARSHLA
jgi:hypothetical protein